jgi:hypothetical protein
MPPKYGVFDNNNPACELGYPELEGYGWDNYLFDTLEEAQEYANKWLGPDSPGRYLKLGEKYDSSGYGDIVEIRLV